MATPDTTENSFLIGPLPALFARTAAPIIFIMGLNGLLTVVDAWFLGVYVGADALTAVTLMFPLFMILIALQTLVSGGMSSVLARALGAGDLRHARQVFVSAHALALLICLFLIVLFAAAGHAVTAWMANGSTEIAAMGSIYIAILVWCSPIGFVVSVNGDALRCEGRLGLMAGISVLVSLANIGFDYLLIAVFDQGVAGSAIGTVLAQVLALIFVLLYRLRGRTILRFAGLSLAGWNSGWSRFAALGAPQSLSFVGLSLSSAAIIFALQMWSGDGYAATVAAYGIATRIMTFAFLPLLGLSMAMQTIVGNNFGAERWERSDAGLRLAVVVALVYGVAFQLAFLLIPAQFGLIFIDDPETVAEVARILPLTTLMYFATGPVMMLSSYFQAIGDAARAAIISMTRTYGLTIPLTLALPFLMGEIGIWLAGPISGFLTLVLVAVLLSHARARTGFRWGVFRHMSNVAPVAV